MIIREALIEDAQGIARVHVDSWRTTYKGIIPENFLKNLTYEQRTELWEKNISNTESHVLVAENNDNQIIGFADGWKREINSENNASDLTSLYLLEAYQGQGIGKKLFKEIFVHFKNLGHEKIFVDVLEDNKTRYFYEYYGAKLEKTVQINIGGTLINELVYRWDNIDAVIEQLQ